MEEIKIWAIDDSQVEELKPTSQTETEKMLEDALVSRPDLLMEDLTLVGRQTQTEGGPLDLLGVDGDGRLVVFELKRGNLTREAVAQVIDYTSYLDSMDTETLASYISERSGSHGIDQIVDFQSWYTGNPDFESLASLKPVRMFLVGLGVDDRTERMVRFLAENSSMDISLLTFHGFDYEGKTILAKQVEVEGPDDFNPPSTGGRLTWKERRELLKVRVEKFGVTELFNSVTGMFSDNWTESLQIPSPRGRSMSVRLPAQPGLTSGRRAYVRMDTWDGGMGIAFYSRSVSLSVDAFRLPIEAIRYNLWPKNKALEDPGTEVYFILTSDEWETHKEKLVTLVQSLYEAWQNRDLKN